MQSLIVKLLIQYKYDPDPEINKKLTIFDKMKLKIENFILSLSGENEYDFTDVELGPVRRCIQARNPDCLKHTIGLCSCLKLVQVVKSNQIWLLRLASPWTVFFRNLRYTMRKQPRN